MKCRYSDEDIALYVEGDLKETELRGIEAHLPECESCRALAAELRESQSMFKSLRQESVSGAALAEVRGRVLAEVGDVNSRTAWGRRLERWLWLGLRRGYALAGVGLAALICVGIWYAIRPSVEVLERVIENTPPPVVLPDKGNTGSTTATPVESRRSRLRKEATTVAAVYDRRYSSNPTPDVASPEPPKQLVVKLLTDDPNIVIYWLVDQNGG